MTKDYSISPIENKMIVNSESSQTVKALLTLLKETPEDLESVWFDAGVIASIEKIKQLELLKKESKENKK